MTGPGQPQCYIIATNSYTGGCMATLWILSVTAQLSLPHHVGNFAINLVYHTVVIFIIVRLRYDLYLPTK